MTGELAFFPDWRRFNPFQTMLFGDLGRVGGIPRPVRSLRHHLTSATASGHPGLLNVHWTTPLLAGVDDEAAAPRQGGSDRRAPRRLQGSRRSARVDGAQRAAPRPGPRRVRGGTGPVAVEPGRPGARPVRGDPAGGCGVLRDRPGAHRVHPALELSRDVPGLGESRRGTAPARGGTRRERSARARPDPAVQGPRPAARLRGAFGSPAPPAPGGGRPAARHRVGRAGRATVRRNRGRPASPGVCRTTRSRCGCAPPTSPSCPTYAC